MTSKTTIALAGVLLLGANAALAANPANSKDSDGDGVPNIAEPLLHTDPLNPDTDGDGQNDLADKSPVVAPDPIVAGSKAAPFHIGKLLVENNVDPKTGKGVSDHLEIQVVNDGKAPISGLTLFYTLTDTASGAQEAYVKHPDITVPAGGSARINVDDSGLKGHLRANPNSMYMTSKSAIDFKVELGLAGYKPVMGTVKKDPGGAEQAD